MNRSFKFSFLAAALVVTGSAFAADQYVDWQWTPHVIADTNADENVRNQLDFTTPVHGPWLTMPKPDSMSVTWITRIPCAGGIRIREKGKTEWGETLWPVKYGQIDYTRDVHNFNLTGLKPATEYEYQLLSNLDNYRTAYHMVVCEGREIRSFKTVDPDRKSFKVWMTADLHGSARLSLEPMIKAAKAEDADFYFFLGDNVEDGMYYDIRYWVTFGFLDEVTRLWGQSKPSIFMRGNHDINGINTYKYGDYFMQPDGKTYQAFRQGGALFISLDTMWPSRVKVQNDQYVKYLVEQRDWIAAMKKTPMWKTAEFRIVMGHVAPFPGEGGTFVGDVFKDFFMDDTPEGRIHLFLTGHHHTYWRFNPNSTESRCAKAAGAKFAALPKYLNRNPMPTKFPYVAQTFNQTATATLEILPGKLIYRNWGRTDAENAPEFLDAFEMTPDCKVTDLVETVATPFPQPPPAKGKKK